MTGIQSRVFRLVHFTLFLGTLVGAQDGAGFSRKVQLKGKYQDKDYGFSVRIPEGLQAYIYCDADGISGSTHGFTGSVSGDPQSEIYVFPQYSPTSGYRRRIIHSTSGALQLVLDDLHPNGTPLAIISSVRGGLGNLDAQRVLARFSAPKEPERTADVIFAVRAISSTSTILYRVGMTVPSSHYLVYKPMLDALISSFKAEPIL